MPYADTTIIERERDPWGWGDSWDLTSYADDEPDGELIPEEELSRRTPISDEQEQNIGSRFLSSNLDYQCFDCTPLVRQHAQYPGVVHISEIVSASSSAAEQQVSDRITLLARKYANHDLTSEEFARLEILSERLRRLFPRVGEGDIRALENTIERLRTLQESADALLSEEKEV